MTAADFARKVGEHYPALNALSSNAKAILFQHATHMQQPAGISVLDPHAPCPVLVFTLSGEKRVFYLDESGKEVTLYAVHCGDVCTLNIVAVLAAKPFPAQVELITDSEFVFVPAADVRRCMLECAEVAAVFYESIYNDTTAILRLLAEVAFRRVNERLKEYLLLRAENGVVHATHQRIANDLGTSREVISRLLKDFAQQGRIEASRGEIVLVPDAL